MSPRSSYHRNRVPPQGRRSAGHRLFWSLMATIMYKTARSKHSGPVVRRTRHQRPLAQRPPSGAKVFELMLSHRSRAADLVYIGAATREGLRRGAFARRLDDSGADGRSQRVAGQATPVSRSTRSAPSPARSNRSIADSATRRATTRHSAGSATSEILEEGPPLRKHRHLKFAPGPVGRRTGCGVDHVVKPRALHRERSVPNERLEPSLGERRLQAVEIEVVQVVGDGDPPSAYGVPCTASCIG